jgi:hypothetical protein
MPTPQQAAENWASAMAQSGQKMQAGVQAVTESPMQKAIAAIPRQVQGVIRAAQDGTTAAGLGRVSLEQWKRLMIDKGVARVASGAAAAKSKFAAFMAEWLPYEASVVAGLPERGDTETNIQRAVTVMRRNAEFRRRGI